jgi:hypothetical protein
LPQKQQNSKNSQSALRRKARPVGFVQLMNASEYWKDDVRDRFFVVGPNRDPALSAFALRDWPPGQYNWSAGFCNIDMK